MKTVHKILFSDAREMKELRGNSIDLMVTSPPYPMIEMWDSVFSKQNPAIADALENNEGDRAFELMNKELDKVWKEVYRVLKEGYEIETSQDYCETRLCPICKTGKLIQRQGKCGIFHSCSNYLYCECTPKECPKCYSGFLFRDEAA